jgi:glutathione S-transferase
VKKPTLNTEFPNLPFIDIDGFVLTESTAIPWLVAKKFKPCLAGNTPEEEAQIIQILGVIGDLRSDLLKSMFSEDYKSGLAKSFAEGVVKAKLAALAKRVTGKQFAVGGHATIADVFIAFNLYFTSTVFTSAGLPCPVATHPGFAVYSKGIWDLPELSPRYYSDAWKNTPIAPPTIVSWLKW